MEKQSNKILIPLAILIASGLIAWGFWTTHQEKPQEAKPPTPKEENSASSQAQVPNIKKTDYILGNPNAEIVFITFSDFECPFCKIFHQTMLQIIEDYGKTGKVAWVLRQFPLHGENSQIKATAVRCAGQEGGNNAFWKMTTKIFQTDFSEKTEFVREQLAELATTLSIDKQNFLNCLESEKIANQIKEDYQSGVSAGVLGENSDQGGTPYTVILTPNNKVYPVKGAQPYNTVKSITDFILQELQR